MQAFGVRRGFNVAAVYKCFIRYVAGNASSVNNAEATETLKSWRDIPGPPSLPLIGPFLSFLPGGVLHGHIGLKLAEQIYNKYGPIARIEGIFGSPDMIWLFDADAVELVHRSENTLPIRPGFASLDYYRKRHNKIYDPQRQTGLITEHGETWKDFRSKVNHIMLQPKTIKLYSDVLAEVASDMVARLKSLRDENNKIKNKIDVEMNLWALESIGVVALGTRLKCLDPNLPVDSEARKLIRNVHDFFAMASKLDFGPSFWRFFSTRDFKKTMKVYEEQESLAEFFIAKAMKNIEESKKNDDPNSEKPILQKLLEIDLHVALVMASDMLVAGVDTAANTALATFYLLAKNPEKQSKLREEVTGPGSRRPYLRACIKESMRIMPVVTANTRVTTKEYNLMGYKIPKDMKMIFAHQFMSNMEQHYPKHDEFIPERWLAGKEDPLHHGHTHPFVNSPFGYGVRMCIGRRIAELELETLVSRVVQSFRVEWEGAPPTVTPTSLNYFTEPFNFVFKDI